MSSARLALLFAVSFAGLVLAKLPLAVVLAALDLESRGVSYTRASGTVWNGAVEGLAWRGHALGGAALAVRPLSLLIGRLGADVALDGTGAVSGKGFVAFAPGGLVVDRLQITADVAAMPVVLPLTGQLAVTLETAEFSSAGCRAIEGTVRTDALVRRPAGLDWSGPVLEGPITCAGGAVVIPLKGDTKTETVAVSMTLARDGAFAVEVEARSPNPALVSVLSAVGFVDVDGRMTLTQRGRWI